MKRVHSVMEKRFSIFWTTMISRWWCNCLWGPMKRNKTKNDFNKAIEKVKQAHSKLREELTLYKRLMEREA